MPTWGQQQRNMLYGDGGFYQSSRVQQQAINDGAISNRRPLEESGGFYEKTKVQKQAELDNNVAIENLEE